jgi:hypothetical protein
VLHDGNGVRGTYYPAVAVGIGSGETEQGTGGVRFEMGIDERKKGLMREEGKVSVEHQNVAESFPPAAGDLNGVSRAELFSLPEDLDGGEGGLQIAAHLFFFVSDQDGGGRWAAPEDGFQEAAQQRFAEKGMENLGKFAFHSGSLSGRHDENA